MPFAAVLSLGILAVPAAAPAAADNGGATAAPAPVAATPPPTSSVATVLSAPAATAMTVGNPVATASASGITLSSRATAMLRRAAHLAGTAAAGATVSVQRQDPLQGWVTVATATAGADGSFDASWKPTVLGAVTLRAVPGVPATSARTAAAADVATVSTTVYRPGIATWFSVEDNGSETACGVKLTHATLGVAHRTLPCGTEIALYYRGRAIVVPVIDRGPYADGVSWDLTKATNDALHGTGRITVGALTLAQAARDASR
ncbi:MAG: Rare lipoprotein [Conexibacter sp.]|nr:Rare lipoprotein [Conexibacter sp.]